jgi:hypothetical protein
MKYAVGMESGATIYITKINKDWFSHSKVKGGIHRQHGDRINLISFFQNKESRLKAPWNVFDHRYMREIFQDVIQRKLPLFTYVV